MTQKWWLLPVVSLMLMSGCLVDDSPVYEEHVVDEPAPAPAPVPPENISAVESVTGASELPRQSGYGCDQSTSVCHEYPFTVEEGTRWYLEAELTWAVSAHDFDLYLFERGNERTSHTASPPSTAARMQGYIDAGNYEFVVVGYLVTADEFRFNVTFEAP